LTNLALKVSGTIQSSGALFTGPIAITDSSKGEGKVLVSNAAGLANWRDPASLGIGGSSTTHGYIQLFGSGVFTVPANVTTLQVEVIGGGASGSYHGGMGGGYALSLLDVDPGQNFNYSIGLGGVAACSFGNSGGNSTFGTITAYGGLGIGAAGSYTFPLSATAGGFTGSDLGARGHSYLDIGLPADNTDKVAGYPSGFPLSRGGGGTTNMNQTQVGVLPTYGGGGNGDTDSGGGGYCGGAGASGAILVRY